MGLCQFLSLAPNSLCDHFLMLELGLANHISTLPVDSLLGLVKREAEWQEEGKGCKSAPASLNSNIAAVGSSVRKPLGELPT
jgi:hypothetical protein